MSAFADDKVGTLMADVENRVFLHLVWATFDRLPKLTPEIREVVFRQLVAVGEELRCPVLAVGGVEDHVHVLIRFSTTVMISELVKRMKGSSSHLIGTAFPGTYFKWQGSYGVFSVNASSVSTICAYIENQEQHHRERTLIASLETVSSAKADMVSLAANSFDGEKS